MARKRKDAELIRGHAAHRRTEGDYMGVLLDAVTLEDWRDVVNNAMTAAKAGERSSVRCWIMPPTLRDTGRWTVSWPPLSEHASKLACR